VARDRRDPLGALDLVLLLGARPLAPAGPPQTRRAPAGRRTAASSGRSL